MIKIPYTTATINKNERCSLIGNPGGSILVLPLGFGTGGLFLATVSTLPIRKAITIKKIFTIVFILVLKKQREILLYNSQVINRYCKVAGLSMKNN